MYVYKIYICIYHLVWTKKVSETANEIITINVCCETKNTALTIKYTTYNT